MKQKIKNKNLMPISDLFKKSWELFKKGFWKLLAIQAIGIGAQIALGILLGIIIIVSLANSGINLPKPALPTSAAVSWQLLETVNQFSWLLILGCIIVLGFLIIQYWISTSVLVMATGITQNLDIKKALKMGWRKKYSFVWINILIGLLVGLGSLFFIIPGIIFGIWFSFSAYILICEDIKGWQALKKSKKLVQDYFWSVFARLALLGLIMLGIFLINIIVQGLGFLLSIGFSAFALVYTYVLYKDLVRVKN